VSSILRESTSRRGRSRLLFQEHQAASLSGVTSKPVDSRLFHLSTDKPMSLPVCKFYITNQSCRFGRNCRYLHPDSKQRHLTDFNHQVQQNGTQSISEEPLLFDQYSTYQSYDTYQDEAVLSKDSRLATKKATNKRSFHPNQRNQLYKKSNLELVENTNKPVCFDYSKHGTCKYGNNCRFSHNLQVKRPNRNEKKTPKSNQICRFFKSGKCDKGESCKFRHPPEVLNCRSQNVDERDLSSQQRGPKRNDGKTRRPNRRRLGKSKTGHNHNEIQSVFSLVEAEKEGISKLRQSELIAIHKQFGDDEITIEEDSDRVFSALIKFVPSEPEWPFDINIFEIQISIPANYPVEMLNVRLPKEQDLPETIRRYIEVTIGEWLEEQKETLKSNNRVELVFKRFYKWLDSVIEDVTTQAMKQLKRELIARAAGVQIFSPKQLQEKLKTQSDESGDDSSDDSEDDASSGEESDDLDSEDDDVSEDDDSDSDSCTNLDPHMKGTEIELRNLKLKDNATDLLFDRLKVVLQCLRCKDQTDLIVHQSRAVSTQCGKCNLGHLVNFRPALVHQFSSVLGYLDLDGCQACDLVLPDCQALVSCLGCSKQTRLEGLVSGQMIDGWCQACNAKFKLGTDSVKLTQLMPSGVDTSVQKAINVAPSKTKKPPKDPSIKEGHPLPEWGACRHYKHSYRWFRFPCCGKAYPCDVCHDKKEDHEHTFANRIICGHCCKEQNFSPDRPCRSCDQHMTKVRSAHWEGGQGCRDKTAMSRNDVHKYKNQNKTVSNHKKNSQKNGKKKTKAKKV